MSSIEKYTDEQWKEIEVMMEYSNKLMLKSVVEEISGKINLLVDMGIETVPINNLYNILGSNENNEDEQYKCGFQIGTTKKTTPNSPLFTDEKRGENSVKDMSVSLTK